MTNFVKELDGDITLDELQLEKLNNKLQLGSSLGRFIEECSYLDIVLASIILIALSGFYFSYTPIEYTLCNGLAILTALKVVRMLYVL